MRENQRIGNPKLIGSIGRLSEALRDTFADALAHVHKEIAGIKDDIGDIKHEMLLMEERLEKKIETVNKNVRSEVVVIKGDMKAMEERLNHRIDVANQNVQAQCDRHHKDLTSQLNKHRNDICGEVRYLLREYRP